MQAYKQLELEYAQFTGSKHAVSVSSGTAALHLALLALGIGPGDEVIVPDYTMAACAFAVSYVGARPVFADVELDTYGLDANSVAKLLTPKTKAIMIVHVYGRVARDMSEIRRIAGMHRIPVIEDACEAQGAIYESQANITCYSFYKNKIIASEEGGMITTDSDELAKKVDYLKNMAFGEKHDYFHEAIGYNYRMADLLAIKALQSLYHYRENNERRRQVEAWYDKRLGQWPRRQAVWFYDIRIDPERKATALERVPGARDSFKPLSSFPMYFDRSNQQPCPNAQILGREVMLLPVRPEMTEDDVNKICDLL